MSTNKYTTKGQAFLDGFYHGMFMAHALVGLLVAAILLHYGHWIVGGIALFASGLGWIGWWKYYGLTTKRTQS